MFAGIRGFFRCFLQRKQPVISQLGVPIDIEDAWKKLVALGLTKEDLLLCIEEYPLASRIRELAAEKLMEHHLEELSVANLATIVRWTAAMPVGKRLAQRILGIAVSKDDLAQVVITTELPMDMRIEAGRRTLALDPKSHDLCRCMDIPELAEEAFQRLLADPKTPVATLRHLTQFDSKFGSRVQEYLTAQAKRVDFTPAMKAIIEPFWNLDIPQIQSTVSA